MSSSHWLKLASVVAIAAVLATGCAETDDPGSAEPAADRPAESTTTTPLTSTSWPLEAPAPKLPVTVTDATGSEVTVSSIDRIASLQGDITEILWTLGLGDNIAVVDTTAVHPPSMLKEKPNAGFFRTLSAEGLLAQKPTLALAHPGAGPPEVLESLRSAGVAVVIIPELNGTDVAEAAEKIRVVGEAVGLADHAAELADQVDAEINKAVAAAEKSATSSPVVAYVVARGQQVFLTGLDSPSNALIAAAGGKPVAEILNLTKSAPLTPEALIGAQPTIIISTHTAVKQAGGEDAFLSMPGIAETPAGKDRRLLLFDDQLIQQFGPRTAQAITELSVKLHS